MGFRFRIFPLARTFFIRTERPDGASFPADKPICHDLARRSDNSCNLSVVRVRAS